MHGGQQWGWLGVGWNGDSVHLMDAGQRAAWAADGVFVIRDALSADDIRALKELVHARTAQASTYIHPEPDARGVLPVLSWGVPEDVKDLWGGSRPGSGLLGWGAPMVSLVAHPRALPCLQEAFGGRDFRLDHDYVFQLSGSAEGTQRGGLHGSLNTETITCVWELSDVTEADGGFVRCAMPTSICLHGSLKSVPISGGAARLAPRGLRVALPAGRGLAMAPVPAADGARSLPSGRLHRCAAAITPCPASAPD